LVDEDAEEVDFFKVKDGQLHEMGVLYYELLIGICILATEAKAGIFGPRIA
jgi:hypothetical protein